MRQLIVSLLLVGLAIGAFVGYRATQTSSDNAATQYASGQLNNATGNATS